MVEAQTNGSHDDDHLNHNDVENPLKRSAEEVDIVVVEDSHKRIKKE